MRCEGPPEADNAASTNTQISTLTTILGPSAVAVVYQDDVVKVDNQAGVRREGFQESWPSWMCVHLLVILEPPAPLLGGPRESGSGALSYSYERQAPSQYVFVITA